MNNISIGDKLYCIRDIGHYEEGEIYTVRDTSFFEPFYKIKGENCLPIECYFIRVPTKEELENEFIQLKFLRDSLFKKNIAEINCKNFQEFKDKIVSYDSLHFLYKKNFNFCDFNNNKIIREIIVESGKIIDWSKKINKLINFTELYIKSESNPKSMTKEEIEEELGYKIKIISK
ncbi:Uncharacterised protein [Clostridioides difficile]|nr:Uncharacterised protein [Clostridioides difficile]